MADEAGPARLFEELVRGYGERAFKFAYGLCGNADEAKELVQEAFYRVLRHWDEVDPARSPDCWYFRVLRNTFLDARRRYDHRKVVSLDAPVEGSPAEETYADILPDDGRGVADGFERGLRDEAVRAAFARLSVEHRAVLALCDVEGRSYGEVAEALGIPPGTVRSRVSRARLALRRALVWRLEMTA